MQIFDFITGDDFRTSLEKDYQELNACAEAKAWKAVHVMAGSIVEAILADRLISINYTGGDPLKMEFAKMVTACIQEKILPDEAAELTTVIRHYRNLIHPGKVIRLEKVVDEQRAKIAQALVKVIIEEVSNHKEKSMA